MATDKGQPSGESSGEHLDYPTSPESLSFHLQVTAHNSQTAATHEPHTLDIRASDFNRGGRTGHSALDLETRDQPQQVESAEGPTSRTP